MSFTIKFEDEETINKTIDDLGDSTNDITKSILGEILIVAVKKNYVNVASKLLNDSRLESYFNTNILVWAMEKKKHTDIIKLILNNERFFLNPNHNELFNYACEINCTEVIEKLLQNGVDPSIKDNYPICAAVCHGNVHIIKLLLNDSRVDVTVSNDSPIRKACELGFKEIVEISFNNN